MSAVLGLCYRYSPIPDTKLCSFSLLLHEKLTQSLMA